MKISHNWLKDFIKIDLSLEKTSELLTDLGLEVEGVDEFNPILGGLKEVVVGKVLSCDKHPNADKLKLTKVDIGLEEPLQIVCGAPNVDAGQKVAVAKIGALLPTPDGKGFTIKKAKIRGVESSGMICALDELGLGEDHKGILVLDEQIAVGTKLADLYNIQSDHIFEIGLTPNRADAMSHLGTARDLRAGMLQLGIDTKLKFPDINAFKVEKNNLNIDIKVEKTLLAPRYMGLSISGIKVQESPDWLKNRLKAIDVKTINNVVDITNYLLHELGQPLHAFDADKINGSKVIVTTLPKGTKFKSLDQVTRTLHEEDLMICDAQRTPMCIAGVLGGVESGVSASTTSIFLESAYFNPVAVRKTAKRHGLNTDASFRFERGIDPNTTELALKRAACLIVALAGGVVSSEITDIYPEKLNDFEVSLNYQNVNRLIGSEIPKKTVQSILKSLDIEIKKEHDKGLELSVPAYRVDVTREVDIVEEILRVYGYNNIEYPNKLKMSICSNNDSDFELENKCAEFLVSQGFYEIMSNSLTKESSDLILTDTPKKESISLLNPLSSDLSLMRSTLLFGGLEAIAHNINRKSNDLKMFEFGKTYHHLNDDYTEFKHLSIFLTGNTNEEHWNLPTKKLDFFYLKGLLESVFGLFGIQGLQSEPVKDISFEEGLIFKIDKIEIARFGLVSSKILKKFDISQKVFFADIKWEALMEHQNNVGLILKALPKFPSVKRDYSLLIDKEITYDELCKTAFSVERKLLKKVDLFDVYEGEKIPSTKKSYALTFVLQDSSKTMQDKQIDKIMQKLANAFEKQFGATLRS
jgi:phenylalanyl-tRNA synthetase beta chain